MGADPRAAILEALTETERIAREATGTAWATRNLGRHDLSCVVLRDGEASDVVASTHSPLAARDAVHIAHHDPTAVLAQVAAIRAVVGLHKPHDGGFDYTTCFLCGVADGSWPCTTLLELADGFTPGWRDGGY